MEKLKAMFGANSRKQTRNYIPCSVELMQIILVASRNGSYFRIT